MSECDVCSFWVLYRFIFLPVVGFVDRKLN